MRLGPATQAALLSRTFCLPSFALAKDHRATCTPKSAACFRCSPEACASGLRFSAPILLGRRIGEAARPGHQRTGHAPNFPRWLTLENHRRRWILVGTESEHLTLL